MAQVSERPPTVRRRPVFTWLTRMSSQSGDGRAGRRDRPGPRRGDGARGDRGVCEQWRVASGTAVNPKLWYGLRFALFLYYYIC